MASHMFILYLALLVSGNLTRHLASEFVVNSKTKINFNFQAWPSADCVELTFELPDNAKECFHEIIEEGTESTLEFQV